MMTRSRHDDLPRREGENLSDATERDAGLAPTEQPHRRHRDPDDTSPDSPPGSADAANKYAGRAKETWGDVTGDEELSDEGTRQRLEAEDA